MACGRGAIPEPLYGRAFAFDTSVETRPVFAAGVIAICVLSGLTSDFNAASPIVQRNRISARALAWIGMAAPARFLREV